MNLKKTFPGKLLLYTLLITFLSNVSANAQLGITSDIDQTLLDNFKKTTTLVVLPDTASPEARQIRTIFEKYWTLSPSKTIPVASLPEYLDKKEYSFFLKDHSGSDNRFADGRKTGGTTYMHFFTFKMNLEVEKKDKKKLVLTDIAWIPLYVNFPGSRAQQKELYYNWEPGFVRSYIQAIQAKLIALEKRATTDNYIDPAKLIKLSGETLYIPDNILIKTSNMGGVQTKDLRDESELFGKYEYKYKMLPTKELSDKVANGSSEIKYYLLYFKNINNKHICVFEVETGMLIYAINNIGNIEEGDIKDLNKEVNKLAGK